MKTELLKKYSKEINLLVKKLESLAGYEISEKDYKLLCQCVEYREFSKKSMILRLGEHCDEFYYIVEGLTRQYYLDAQGKEVTRGFAAENEFCCSEVKIQTDGSSPYSIEALEDCRFMAFRLSRISDLYASRFFIDAYIRALELDLRSRMVRDSSFLTEGALERYKRFVNEYPNISARVKQIHLASYLGITPESLSRIRKAIVD